MVIRYPDWIIELKKIYAPYMVGCHLENPTPEAEEAHRIVLEWLESVMD